MSKQIARVPFADALTGLQYVQYAEVDVSAWDGDRITHYTTLGYIEEVADDWEPPATPAIVYTILVSDSQGATRPMTMPEVAALLPDLVAAGSWALVADLGTVGDGETAPTTAALTAAYIAAVGRVPVDGTLAKFDDGNVLLGNAVLAEYVTATGKWYTVNRTVVA